MSNPQKIDHFVARVCQRLNRFRLFDALIWAFLLAAAVLSILCLSYILRGYAVPKPWFAIAAVGALLGAGITWLVRRWSRGGAARYADDFFGLKDSLSSSLSFRKGEGDNEFVPLQEQSTARKIESLDPADVRYRKPGKLLAITAALVGLCTLMAFKEASPDVLERIRVEEQTETRTAEINEHLEEIMEDLEKGLDEDQKELLKPNELKEWVEEMSQTKDRNEAMRQYAKLERKLQEAARRMDQRKNEQVLAKAAEKLQKDDQNRALGKKIEEKKYREAAADLEQMKPSEVANKKLSEQRKELARLKSASQRMAAAAKASNRKSSSSKQSGNQDSKSGQDQAKNGSSNSKSSGKAGGANGSSGSSGNQIDADIAALEESLKKFDNALKNAELQEKQLGQCDSKSLSECKSCRSSVLSNLDKLSKSMCKTASLSECQSKLLSMCKTLGQCQGYLGQKKQMSLSQCLSAGKGGQNAGVGSVESRRDQTDLLTDNGNTTQLKGIQGQGPSQSTVESAEEGSGVSSRRTANRKLEFSRQVESFVQREDVPEDVKQGVKNYFENIHQGTAE